MEKHNGWANYETWIVYTWMNHNELLQKRFSNMVLNAFLEAVPSEHFTKDEEAVIILSEKLKEFFEDWMYDESESISGVFKDLLHGALSDVDWWEIASHSMEEMEV